MAKSLKTAGIKEVTALRVRVNRQFALERILPSDRDRLIKLLDQFEAHVVSMSETDPDNQEVQW